MGKDMSWGAAILILSLWERELNVVERRRKQNQRKKIIRNWEKDFGKGGHGERCWTMNGTKRRKSTKGRRGKRSRWMCRSNRCRCLCQRRCWCRPCHRVGCRDLESQDRVEMRAMWWGKRVLPTLGCSFSFSLTPSVSLPRSQAGVGVRRRGR